MSNLGKALFDDLERLFKSSRYNDFLNDVVGKGYREKINEMNNEALEPDGDYRIDLSEDYKEYKSTQTGDPDPMPDLYLGGGRYKTFGYFADTSRSEVNFDYSDKNVAEYMYQHEYGVNGMPLRRQFPVEDDHSTVTMASSSDIYSVDSTQLADSMAGVIYKGMEEVLNEERTIVVKVNL